MTRTLTIIALSILSAAFMTACGGDDSTDDKCAMSFDGKPVQCEVTTAPK